MWLFEIFYADTFAGLGSSFFVWNNILTWSEARKRFGHVSGCGGVQDFF
jgi:hypothetical protein